MAYGGFEIPVEKKPRKFEQLKLPFEYPTKYVQWGTHTFAFKEGLVGKYTIKDCWHGWVTTTWDGKEYDVRRATTDEIHSKVRSTYKPLHKLGYDWGVCF